MPVDAYSIYYDVTTGRRSAEDVQREIEERAARAARVMEEAWTEAAEELAAEESGADPAETTEPATAQDDTQQETT